MDDMVGIENRFETRDRVTTASVRPAAPAQFGPRGNPVSMVVMDYRMLSDSVLQLTLQRKDGGLVAFQPGQFCSIVVPDGDDSVERSYSIATLTDDPQGNRVCQIAITRMEGGLATNYLFSRQVGDEVDVLGPFGRLVLPPEDPTAYVLIGTGTGVAPYRAMLPELERRAALQSIDVTLVMGVRRRDDLIYGDDFQSFAARHAWFRFVACYSRETELELAPFERRGRVHACREELACVPGRDRVYLCGHPEMIDDWNRELRAAGFDRRHIVREKYVSSRPPRRPQAGKD